MRVLRLILYCFLATAASSSEALPQEPPRRDAFLITIDTLRSDHLHCYGYDRIQTPAIDQLAKQGIRFTQAFTPSPLTNSSHASILTGLLPSSHGVSDFGVPLKSDHPTLAELQKKQGYQTAAFIGSVILDSQRLAPGLDRGFDFYDNFPAKPQMKLRWGQIERRGMDVAQRAENWMDEHEAAPRFVWVHFYDPHDPYEPPSPYAQVYKGRLYDGEIAYADSALGHFLAYLKKRGWYEGALIVLVGDHGEGLGEHHEDTHGIFLYDSTTHVPLIVKLPKGQQAGRVVDEQVRTTDIMPTILELLGISTPASLDGASLMPLILGANSASRPVLGETDYPLRFGWAPLRSVRQDGFKLIEAPRPELYDLHSDAGELHNHYAPWDARVQTLRKRLAERAAESQSPRKPSPSTVSSGTIDELHALGYLGPADARSSTDVPEPSLLPDPKDKIEEQNLMHIATMASEVEQWAQARVALEKLVQLDDKSLVARLLLGRVDLNSKNPQAAEHEFEAAVLLQPGNMEAQFGLAKALLGEKKYADAVDLLEEITKSGTKNPEAFELLAQAYTGLGKPVLAKQAADQASTIRGAHPRQ
ncbi:MAG TPA: sulfatase-like hydrolase/transferase [Candidatus Acidoferrum sp.]|nr:sulfatase-like hydrolase/transferase [Candidatus Acidoferrum sp.]